MSDSSIARASMIISLNGRAPAAVGGQQGFSLHRSEGTVVPASNTTMILTLAPAETVRLYQTVTDGTNEKILPRRRPAGKLTAVGRSGELPDDTRQSPNILRPATDPHQRREGSVSSLTFFWLHGQRL